MLPYSDLMTLLLALFIVLYSMSTTDAKKFEEMSQAFKTVLDGGTGVMDQNSTTQNPKDPIVGRPRTAMDAAELAALKQKEQEDLEKLKKQIDQYIKENGLTSELSTKLNQSELVITISDVALFPSGDAAVKPEARILAKAISNMLQQFPNYNILVSGHTDNVPIYNDQFESNWELSSARALNFMKILLLNQHLDPKKFSAVGYGEYHPVADNNTNEGRAKNRRVEVSILRKYQSNVQSIQVPAK
nr:OmpA family protein [Paenibacillus sediminis]